MRWLSSAKLPLWGAYFALAASASEVRALEPEVQFEAAFADGDRIVLASPSSGTVTELRGPNIRVCDAAALSPDGKTVAFTNVDEATNYAWLYAATAPAFKPVRIGANRGWHRDPSWSPDGKRLAFALHPDSRFAERFRNEDPAQLWEEDMVTGTIHRISPPGHCHHFPSYSADGKALYFTLTDCQFTWNLAKIDVATGKTKLVTLGRTRDHQPTISPDGSRLAYAHVSGDHTDVMVMPSSGGKARAVYRIKNDIVPQLRWARDGRHLLWMADHAVEMLDLESAGAKAIRLERTGTKFAAKDEVN